MPLPKQLDDYLYALETERNHEPLCTCEDCRKITVLYIDADGDLRRSSKVAAVDGLGGNRVRARRQRA